MLTGAEIVEQVLDSDPGVKDATLLSRSRPTTTDVFTSYAWRVLLRPSNQQAVAAQNVQTGKTTTTWGFLRESQTVLPKRTDRVTVEGVTWTILEITNIRWDSYGFDALCVKDAA